MTLADRVLELSRGGIPETASNGAALAPVLHDIPPERALVPGAADSLSPWQVAALCAWCHWRVHASLANAGLANPAAVPAPAPRATEDPANPASLGAEEWKAAVDALEAARAASIEAIGHLDETGLQTLMPEWKMTFGEAIAWLLGHDSFQATRLAKQG